MKSFNATKRSHSFWILSGLMVVGLFGRAGISQAAEGTWIYKADMPTARTWVGGCVLDEKIYVVGGATSTSSVTSAVEMYDPMADTWTRMADMPSARCAHATCVYDGNIYVFGGISPGVFSTAKKNVYVYDPQTDTWSQKADMPYANAHCAVAVVDGMIYLIGGMLSVSSPPIQTVMAYDPITESWTQKADMPTARGLLSACVVDGMIYAIGGATENWGVFCYKHVQVYDPLMNTWTRKSDMPTERFSLGTCAVNGKIYAIGGHLRNDACKANEVYDPGTDTWAAETPLQHKRLGHFLGLIGDKIFAVGGSFPNPAPTVLSTAEEYDTGLGVPSPDFNNDSIVDVQDLVILIESWGKDDPLCDIAPTPFGDGIVDALDLELFMSYWGQEIDDPTLIAHWALDETEGAIAYDSGGVNDASIVGNAVWQPDSGQVNGALHFDGVSDCAVAGPILNPTVGPFSVIAWVNGGLPGQVVISQQGATNWLAVDDSGYLMTELRATGRSGGPLHSQAIITDGFWHRVGFVWNGASRILYVDDIQVAEDTQDGLESSNRGLYIGTGKSMQSGTYFSGLIDDIRIYNRAVSP